MNGSTIIARYTDGIDGLSRLTFCRDTLGIGTPGTNTDVGFTFDSISRVLEEQQTYNGLQFVTQNAWTSYPSSGFSFPDGRHLTIGFDALYSKNAVNETSGAANIAAWQFFGARIATVTLGNNMVTSFMNNAQTRSAVQSGQTTPAWGDITTDHLGYDGSGRLIGKRHWLPGGGTSPTTLVGFTTAYDPSSNKLFERALHAEDRSSLYANDSMDRLTGYKRGTLATGGTGIGTPTSLPGIDVQRGYALDGLGNWLNTNYQPEGGSTQLEVRTHNRLNQVLAFGVAPTSTPVVYDHGNNTGGNASRGNGNIVNDGTRTYVLDALNRVRTVSRTGGTGNYTYDALGRRVHIDRTITGGPTFHGKCLYDGQQVVEEITGLATSMQYVWGQYIDELIQLNAVYPAGPNSLTGIYYLLSDLLYRSAALTDTSGTPQIVEAYDTDAYGNTLLFSAAGTGGNWFADNATQAAYSACRFVFTGREYDPESGNYFYRARYYSPGLGRFAGRDALLYEGAMNLFAYADDSPAVWLDPFGFDPASAPPATQSAPPPPQPAMKPGAFRPGLTPIALPRNSEHITLNPADALKQRGLQPRTDLKIGCQDLFNNIAGKLSLPHCFLTPQEADAFDCPKAKSPGDTFTRITGVIQGYSADPPETDPKTGAVTSGGVAMLASGAVFNYAIEQPDGSYIYMNHGQMAGAGHEQLVNVSRRYPELPPDGKRKWTTIYCILCSFSVKRA